MEEVKKGEWKNGAVETYKKGMVPLPTRLTLGGQMKSYARVDIGVEEDNELTELYGFNLAELRLTLKARCTRICDDTPWSGKCTSGMYREGVKWACGKIHSGEISGQVAVDVLDGVGVPVGLSTILRYATMVSEDGTIASPNRRGRSAKLLPAGRAALRKWAFTMRAMSTLEAYPCTTADSATVLSMK